jgi:hypothetical protein
MASRYPTERGRRVRGLHQCVLVLSVVFKFWPGVQGVNVAGHDGRQGGV